MKIIAIYSMKGGVGKTSAAVNLAYHLREDGSRVLLVDLDPQGAAGFFLRVSTPEKVKFGRRQLSGSALKTNIRETDFPGLDLLPSNLAYRNLDLRLNEMKKSRGQLREVLAAFSGEYDRVVLDCPPGLTLLAENVIRAANVVAVPITPSPLSLRTLDHLNGFLKGKNAGAVCLVPFLSMVDTANPVHTKFVGDFELQNGPLCLVPLSRSVEAMGEERKPVGEFDPDGEAVAGYRRLREAVMAALGAE